MEKNILQIYYNGSCMFLFNEETHQETLLFVIFGLVLLNISCNLTNFSIFYLENFSLGYLYSNDMNKINICYTCTLL